MRKLKGRLITTHLTRDNIRFTKEALEGCIKQINEGDRVMPFNLNHDTTRQIGFVIPGSAKLIHLEDGEWVVEAEINLYENEDERIRYFVDTRQKETEVVLDGLGINALKKDDTNCPTYLLRESVFSIIKKKPKLNNDKDNLLVVNHANEIYQKGILIEKKFIVLYHPFLRRSFTEPNSFNKRLVDKIKEIKIRNNELQISFRIIPNTISLKSEFKESIELDYAWGPKIPRDLSKLQMGVTKHISNEKDKILENVTETDFWWHQENGTMALEIEEVRDKSRYLLKDSLKYFPLRYSHLQYDKNSNKVIHLDCSVRIYSEEQYDERVNKNDISKAGKDSVRFKLFRCDGVIDPKDAFDILSLFFYGNSDVRQYFELETEA